MRVYASSLYNDQLSYLTSSILLRWLPKHSLICLIFSVEIFYFILHYGMCVYVYMCMYDTSLPSK